MIPEPLRWSSSDFSVAEVSEGVIYAKSAGTVTIKAETLDSRISASCTLTVTGHGKEGVFRIDGIAVRNESGNDLRSIPKDKFFAAVSLTNETSADSPQVILAAYDGDGKFVTFIYVQVKASPNATVEVALPIDNTDGEIKALKAFAVTSFDDLTPIGNVISFSAA